LRLIHTADWQIGKVFRFVDSATMALLQDARLEAIKTIGRLALEHDAGLVLVAGDVFDKEGLADRTIGQALERMRSFARTTWHLIPGNHDPNRPGGIWQRVTAMGVPENVVLHLEPVPAPLGDGCWLLPCSLQHRHDAADPSAWMNDAATPEGALRIGLAHGSITDFGLSSTTPNRIAPDRAKQAGLGYLALGDWHGTKEIDQRTWYAGTPEPDQFGQIESGQALLVTLGAARAPVAVTPLPTGRYRWQQERATLHDTADVTGLAARLRETGGDLSTLLLSLTVEGSLSLADRAAFEEEIGHALAAALCHLRLDTARLTLAPSAEDFEAMASDRVIQDAVMTLRRLAEDPAAAEQPVASLALRHLYLHCRRPSRAAAAGGRG
jgi:DNA repair exonuclease SbcCD nuclease subunit